MLAMMLLTALLGGVVLTAPPDSPGPHLPARPKLRGFRVGISCLTRHANLPMTYGCSQESLACRQYLNAACCYDALMMVQPTAMHVVRIKSRHTDRQGRERQYESRLLRHTWRDGAKVRNETLANLSRMPDRIVDAVEAALKGQVLVPAGEAAVSIARSLPHGHVAAVHAMGRWLVR